MRISGRWAWIPLAITVAGVVYLSMVKLANYQAALREPVVVRDPPKPFLPPPPAAKHLPEALPAPPDIDAKPVLRSPLPNVQLPPFDAPASAPGGPPATK